MTDEQLIEAMAKAIDNVEGPMGFSYEQFCAAAATAALAALRKTHHLIPRAAGDDGELVNELTAWPASLGKGDALEVGFVSEKMQRAAAAITALSAEVERLTRLTEAMATVLENNSYPSTAKLLRADLGAKP